MHKDMFEQISKPLKIVLSVLFAAAVLAVLMNSSSTQTQTQKEVPSNKVVTSETARFTTPTSFVSMEDAQKQFKAIQDQVNAGTLSAEKAKKQMDAVAAQIEPPPLPPEAKKQMEEAKKARQ